MDVDWIVMGSCPADLRPYITEFHPHVGSELRPKALAGMHLDLALIPAKHEGLGSVHSAKQLLEYGACGVAVLCSDLPKFHLPLSANHIPLNASDWQDAIHCMLNNPEALLTTGETLRAEVLKNWMLDEVILKKWLSSWLA